MNNKKQKKITLLVFSLFFIILFFSNIQAIQITPGRTTVDFDSDLKKAISFDITNSEEESVSLLIYKKGTLKEYISIDTKSIDLSPGETKTVTYVLELPNKLSPGTNKGEITIVNFPNKQVSDEVSVGATSAITHQVHVLVPYPDEYAEIDNPNFDSSGGETTSHIPIINRGEKDLKNVRAIVNIYTLNNEKIDSYTTANMTILKGERKEIISKWNKSVNPGKYEARIKIIYGDGKEDYIEYNKTFTTGKKEMNIKEIKIKDFSLGEITKFSVFVENKWNLETKNVYFETMVYDKKNKIISRFKSPSEDISAMSEKKLTAYWDTKEVKKGKYNASIMVYYGNQTNEKKVEFDISQDKINIIGTGNIISETNTSNNSGKSFFVVIAIFALIIVVMRFFYLRRKLKKEAVKKYYGY